MNPYYVAGVFVIGIGAGLAYLGGYMDGQKRKEAETWEHADDTNVGTMDDVSRIRHRDNPSSHPA